MKEKDILYQNGPFWVKKSDTFDGFEVYRDGLTHATRCASIGYKGEYGLNRAIQETDRRARAL